MYINAFNENVGHFSVRHIPFGHFPRPIHFSVYVNLNGWEDALQISFTLTLYCQIFIPHKREQIL